MLAASLAASREGRAQSSPDEIARRELITQADVARRSADHERALDLYARAGALRMTASLRQLLAYEQHALGHVLEALDEATQCAREATVDAALPERQRILDTCTAIAAAEESRVGRVVVEVPAEAPRGLRVRVDGRELPAALWSAAWPSLPGSVRVEATADDVTSEARVVEVIAGAVTTMHLGPFVPVRVAAAPVPVPPPIAPPPPVLRPPPAARASVGPWILAGVGAAAFGASIAFGVLRADARDARDAACATLGCEATSLDADARFRGFTVATDVALAVGTIALASGAVWYFVARPASQRVQLGVGVVGVRF